MNKKLPEIAYRIFSGFKLQAQAMHEKNSELLAEAQVVIGSDKYWADAIFYKIANNSDGLRVRDLDDQWLDSEFDNDATQEKM